MVFGKSAKSTFEIKQNLLKITQLSFTKAMENIYTIKESIIYNTLLNLKILGEFRKMNIFGDMVKLWIFGGGGGITERLYLGVFSKRLRVLS